MSLDHRMSVRPGRDANLDLGVGFGKCWKIVLQEGPGVRGQYISLKADLKDENRRDAHSQHPP